MADKKGKKEKTVKSGLRKRILQISMVPVLILGIIITCFTYFEFNKTMELEVRRNLKNVADATYLAYDKMFPGDFNVQDDDKGGYIVYKGDTDISEAGDYIEKLHEDSGIDITIAYLDVRMLTTLQDKNGNPITGTIINKKVIDDLMSSEDGCFYDNLKVNDVMYYAYYEPIYGSDGAYAGTVFAGKPSDEVRREVMESALPIVGIAVAMMLIMSFVATSFAKELADVIDGEKNFLGAIANGNLRASLDSRIIARKDELGEMGRFTVHVQKFIRDMIERDTLTKLYTRRIGEIKIELAMQNAIENHIPYCLVMCDIDFFKKFNDTYGHDCGDLVLRETAAIFNRVLFGDGFAVRWGGEEFIIVYEDKTIDESYKLLSNLREEVVNNRLDYNGEDLHITMTFGLVEGDERSLDELVKCADNLLYYGKQNGRNQIVRSDSPAILQEE